MEREQIRYNMYVYGGYLPLVLFEHRALGQLERIEKYFKAVDVGKIKRSTIMDSGDLIMSFVVLF